MSEPPVASDTETSAPDTETSAPDTEPPPPSPGRGPAPSPARSRATSPWRRLLWVLAPLGLWIASPLTPLVGVDLGPLLDPEGGRPTPGYDGPLTMGISPILTGYVLVEIVALAAIPWRHLRSTRRGRARLSLAALVTALVLAAVTGWRFVAAFHESAWLVGSPILPTLTLVALTAVVWAVLHAADRNGAGSSMALLAGLVSTGELVRAERSRWIAGAKDADLPQAATFAGLLALAALATLLVLKRGAQREAPPGERAALSARIPSGGLVPLWTIAILAALVPAPLARTLGLARLADVPWVVWLALLLVAWPWLLQPPSQVGAAWAVLFEPAASRGAGEPISGEAADQAKADAAYAPPLGGDGSAPTGTFEAAAARLPPARMAVWAGRARAVLLRAMVPTLAYLAVVAWPVWPVLGRPDDPWRRLAGVAWVCLLVAAIRDIVAETRFRLAHRDAVPLHAEQRLAAADAALAALSAEGIPAFARNGGARTLLSFFGPYAPLEILVPEEHAPAARERLAALLEPPEPTPGERPPAAGEPAKPRPRKKGSTAKRRKPKPPVTG